MAKKTLAAVIVVLLIYGLVISCSSKTNPASPSAPDGELPTPNLTLTPPLIPTFTETNTVDPLSTYTFTNTYTDTPQETFTETYTQTYTETETPTYTYTVQPTFTYTQVPSQDAYEDENTSITAVELPVDTIRYASIYPISDTDWMWFELYETKGVSVIVKTGNAYAGLNAYLYESDASTDIYGEVSSYTEENTFIRYAVLGAGTYFINLPNFMGIPAELNYTIQLVTEPGVLPTSTDTYTAEPTFTSSETPTPIDSWEPQDNEWSTAPQLTPEVMQLHAADYPDNSIDWAFLMLPEPAYISIITGGAPISAANRIFLYMASGVVSNDYYRYDSGNLAGNYSGINAVLEAGTYYVKVENFEDNPGYHILYTVLTSTYTHTAEPTHTYTNTATPELTPDIYEDDDGCGFSKPIENGETQTRQSWDTDDDWVHFTVNAHCLADITTSGGDGGDTYLQLFSDPCSGLITADDNSNGNGYSKISISLTPGLYGLKITSPNVPDGFIYNYTLSFQLTEYTPTSTYTATETHTNTHTVTETGTDTNTATATYTHTYTATATNTALPGTVWTKATGAAEFGRRGEFASFVFDDGTGEKMWVTGGMNYSEGTGNTPTFKSADGITWTYVPQNTPMPFKIQHTAHVYNGKIYVLAGSDGANASAEVFESVNGTDWLMTTGNAAFGRRTYHASALFDDGTGQKMWIIGGRDQAYSLLNSVYYSSDGALWNLAASNPEFSKRKLHTVLSYNNKIWVIGGLDATETYLNDVWSSSDGITWIQETAAAGFAPRAAHVSFVHQSRMWVIGGYNSTTLGDAWSSTDGVTWTQISTDSSALWRESFAGCIYDGKMWIMGGRNEPEISTASVWWSY
ncbi:MAG: hypothetical protein CVV21_06055 [Candidatus Goldiibacteriota bacterium HGW-Goldbacteria-1]|nr:MAG: hypothetical protein CVV21_06055 [Candidatus Goldiibacteriota bacterium HGW-Goldbacteria-1]